MNAFKYTAKVWVTTALVSPIFFLLVSFFNSKQEIAIDEVLSGYFILVFVELLCSLLSTLLFCLAVDIIIGQNLSPAKQQQTLFISALTFGVLTFAIFFTLCGISITTLFSNILYMVVVIANLTCLAFSSIIYKIPQTEN